jgi:hypothetical protein
VAPRVFAVLLAVLANGDARLAAFTSPAPPENGSPSAAETAARTHDAGRLRVIVETDAGGDPDDEQSLVRFLVYANEFDVEGIIVNRGAARDGENLNAERTGLGIVQRLARAYGACADRLRQHDSRYPAGDEMLGRVVSGTQDSEQGMRLIIAAVDGNDRRPIWYLNWGTIGGSDPSALVRALDRVHADRTTEEYARFKSRIYLSSDDQFGAHTYQIGPPFPLWIDTFRPELDRRRWYHRFSAITADAGGFDLERDVRSNHGPLGELYPTNTTHRQKEGDTMTFLYLVPTGMNDPLQPTWGSWAGRYGKRPEAGDRPYYFANQVDTWRGTSHRENSLARWAADLQNDFRARMDWCVNDRSNANHPPRVVLRGPAIREVQPGQRLELDASQSIDPDGDRCTWTWEFYREPGTLQVELPIEAADRPAASVTIPQVERAAEAHLVCTVRDTGSPPLARYARIILRIRP